MKFVSFTILWDVFMTLLRINLQTVVERCQYLGWFSCSLANQPPVNEDSLSPEVCSSRYGELVNG